MKFKDKNAKMEIPKLFILILLLFTVTLTSCAQKSISDFKDKNAYIDYLKGKSLGDLKTALTKDTLYLQTRIDSVKDIVFYEDFSLSPTDNDETNNHKLEQAKKFTLTNVDSIKQSFLRYNETLLYTQKYALPNSEFRFSTAEDSDFLLDRNLSQTITNAYLGRDKLIANAIKLSTPDSIAVQTSYHYPTKFETLTINRNIKKTNYKDFEIEVDTIYKSVVHLSLPGALAPKILGCQAVNKEGILMDSHGYYSYPNRGLSNETLFDLNLLKSTLSDAIKAPDKEKALTALDKIPENVFELLATVNDFNADIMKVDENAEDSEVMGKMDSINEKYVGILGVKKQQIKMYFDDDVEKLYVFIATKIDTLNASVITKAKDDSDSKYRVFHQEDIGKYGIVDKKGNIVINAEYNKLVDQGNSYFEEEIDPNSRKRQTYYLDVAAKKLIKIPEGLSFRHKYTEEYSVFENENRQVGLLKNNSKTIVPFKYLNLAKKDNVFMAYDMKDNARIVDLYNIEGDKIQLTDLMDVDFYDDLPGILVVGKNGLKGLVDKDGKTVLPVKYNGLYYLPGSTPMIVYYEKKAKESVGQLRGLMTSEGKILTPAFYRQIHSFTEDLSLFNLLRNEHDVGNYGFVDTSGKVALPAIYQHATSFNEGFSFVQKDEMFFLINKQGKYVVTFPQKNVKFFDDKGDGKDRRYILDEKTYNYKGDLIPTKK
ncbi:WG repeat-containing protein [Pedobacter changchengzhani]|uniref:WG repeat-containing protein n=1 Tax=Pedobacter changchengzhani TaxID=2529274 RepID=A0A4V3A012_9SPHI|nr:WG repeat-containing protein [Pedobacter changchengzhani]TDG35603.1 WG repeat-containing protein [Pedobacter changchengzhani]